MTGYYFLLIVSLTINVLLTYLLASRKKWQKKYSSKAEEKKVKYYQNLIAFIAHDVRSPLNSFSLLLDSLLAYEKRLEFRNVIHELQRDFKIKSSVVNNILDWSNLQIRCQEPLFENVSLLAVLKNSISFNKDFIKQKKITVHLEITINTYVITDAYRLEVICRNILWNAIKYSYFGQKIRVSLEIMEKRQVIRISDSGKGIDERICQIINKNMILSKSEKGTQNEVGYGLGFFISKEISKNIGIRITAERNVGKGTSILIHLPNRVRTTKA